MIRYLQFEGKQHVDNSGAFKKTFFKSFSSTGLGCIKRQFSKFIYLICQSAFIYQKDFLSQERER